MSRSVLNVAIALCVWWNIALMAEFGTSMMESADDWSCGATRMMHS